MHQIVVWKQDCVLGHCELQNVYMLLQLLHNAHVFPEVLVQTPLQSLQSDMDPPHMFPMKKKIRDHETTDLQFVVVHFFLWLSIVKSSTCLGLEQKKTYVGGGSEA